jgi:hypothetical protein
MKRIQSLAILLLMGSLVRPVGAEPLDNWHSPTAPLVTETLKAAAFGSGTFVSVGGNGAILSSADGKTWSQHSFGTTNSLNDVTFCNNTFVAVGEGGTILTSPNGADWTAPVSGVYQTLDGITCGNNLFVTVGGSNTVLTSTNTQQWTPRDPTTQSQYFEAVAYGNGMFVAVGENGTIITSSNGTDWGKTDSGTTTSLHDIVHGNGLWVAVGSNGVIRKSSNGTDWTASSSGSTNWLRNVLFHGSNFVVVGDSGLILSSTNASTWSKRTSNTSQLLWGLATSDSAMVTVGMSGFILRTDLQQAFLNLFVSGSGGGEVSIFPGNLVSSTSILHGFSYGSLLTLQATPFEYSIFEGWSEECSGTGACNLSMDVDRSVTAGFVIDWAHATRIVGGGYYRDITSAYGAADASGTVIDAWGIAFPETLVLNQSKSVTLKGGFTSAYSPDVNGYTSVAGIRIESGSLIVERIAVK